MEIHTWKQTISPVTLCSFSGSCVFNKIIGVDSRTPHRLRDEIHWIVRHWHWHWPCSNAFSCAISRIELNAVFLNCLRTSSKTMDISLETESESKSERIMSLSLCIVLGTLNQLSLVGSFIRSVSSLCQLLRWPLQLFAVLCTVCTVWMHTLQREASNHECLRQQRTERNEN